MKEKEKEEEEEEKDFVSHVENKGDIHISNEVLAGIAATAAKEVDGVKALSGGRLTASHGQIQGKKLGSSVEVEVEGDRISVNLSILVQYGCVIPDVARAVQDAVSDALEKATGMSVDNVNVQVAGVTYQR
ncbi:MAG: Asp23/Gls24 family envelope stress response protein [Oscillospiraceae bacterium]|nr:Asp23/Gls24 family envelope stress response protein [Oscillospiraceae bacterium]